MIGSLVRLVKAPIRVADALVVRPLADVAEALAEGVDGKW